MTTDMDYPDPESQMGKENKGYEVDIDEKTIHEYCNGTTDVAKLKEQEAMGTQGYDVSKDVEIPMEEDSETQEQAEEEDPWNIVPLFRKKKVTPWNELTSGGKVKRILWDWIIVSLFKLIALLGLLYTFVCSLQVMSSAFQLLGGKAAGDALSQNEILNNPVCGLMIGVLVTVLVQSSSTSTSIIVSMVGAKVLTVPQAIPMVMGANIGTSVTNTIVALTQAKDRDEFRRAFGGATVHDMFNWLAVLILLPLEVVAGYLEWLSRSLLSLFHVEPNENVDVDFLDAITKPVTQRIVQIDKGAITDIALNQTSSEDVSLLKRCAANETGSHCNHLFAYSDLSDAAVGTILLLGSLLTLCICLILLVKLLQWMLSGSLSGIIRKAINADFPGPFSFLTGYLAILVGAVVTFLVQSSSVFTSAITPLVGMGLITIDRMYPLTLGSNIGTTGTSILAAFSQVDNFDLSLQIALCHLFFNITGIIIWYPIPFLRKVPIHIAKGLGNNTAKYRWFAIFYLLFAFFLLPGVVFGLTLAGTVVFLSVAVPSFVLFAVIVLINILQVKAPRALPKVLRDWTFLPKPLRSLQPYDEPMKRIGTCCSNCCHSCPCCDKTSSDTESQDSYDVEMATKK
ncbi:Sodium-dependent phosphate transport protein 2A [Holothuria leucospilota]|uniref:Sodium-dependent phosphate transport protein 2A n=1 Tax=Holothuria leucospilota TaxID=206669 RepID=A0A9Q1H854_HOLLE|nr:Sodium-dependent phosphate transport protein 2A [Holothuria leucospilota]